MSGPATQPIGPATHLDIDTSSCGRLERLAVGQAEVVLTTTSAMAVDDRGLVHGGFVFGAADHAAMLAVNHPNVVLGSANVKFTAPVRAGQTVRARAVLVRESGRKREVEVEVFVLGDDEAEGEAVLLGTFNCAVLDQHVLDRK
jgi:acyl-coenzyme A thioesterase PaaI-like protein